MLDQKTQFHRIINSQIANVIETYLKMPEPPPLSEACALVIQGDDEFAVIICPEGTVAKTLRHYAGEDWPEFADYAEERLRQVRANGLLRVVVACDAGFGQVRVSILPGAPS